MVRILVSNASRGTYLDDCTNPCELALDGRTLPTGVWMWRHCGWKDTPEPWCTQCTHKTKTNKENRTKPNKLALYGRTLPTGVWMWRHCGWKDTPEPWCTQCTHRTN